MFRIHGKGAKFNGSSKVIPVEEGGFGGQDELESAAALGVVSKLLINKPNGYAGVDTNNKLLRESFGEKISNIPDIGLSLDGPLQLYPGQTSVYFMTEWIRDMAYSISVNVGSVVRTGREISVTAPTTGSEVELTINGRTIGIPIVQFAPIKPVINYPRGTGNTPRDFKVLVDRYLSLPVFYGAWVSIVDAYTLVDVPVGASAIEIEGRNGGTGQAYVEVDGIQYKLFVSTSRRKVKLTNQTKVLLNFKYPGSIKYRFVTCNSTHVSTDWQISSNSGFTTIVRSSTADVSNKTSWVVNNLAKGQYYIRCRFKGSIAI